AREKSLTSRPSTMLQSPLDVTTGKDEMMPSATPYSPLDLTAMETQSLSAEPNSQSRAASMVAEAAEAAEDEPRASMIAAPRLATVGMKVDSNHSWSLTSSAAFLPPTLALNRSGYWVAEWLPQIVMLVMSVTDAPVFAASCE